MTEPSATDLCRIDAHCFPCHPEEQSNERSALIGGFPPPHRFAELPRPAVEPFRSAVEPTRVILRSEATKDLLTKYRNEILHFVQDDTKSGSRSFADAQDDTEIAQDDTEIAQDDTEIAQDDTEIAQDDTVIAQVS